ncbi:glycosyltransferase family 25 protein [Haemophilus haemolyticus]|jgi:hypothetical protein|nr:MULTISPECIES: glycosyltransferase family 25 protein [Haemophilus]TPH05447.1 glycosyltransferase family 25 protein [Haemophilus haemolyticus]TPH25845.1 glycosyltransferase family 25 protein [Haemophilus haemolyticus]UJZ90498.1 glycosyltransferase family 25 protein [Haemophilus seminalis]
MHTNYVISLSSASQRREHIIKEFGKHHIPFEFYDAITPSECLNQLIQTYLPNLAHAKLSEGEKACFMSHYMLWKKCIDENLPYIYIFEDDVLLGEDAYSFLAEDEWLKERFTSDDSFILRFETHLMPVEPDFERRKVIKKIFRNREIRLLENFHYGTAGYIINYNAVIMLYDLFREIEINDIKPIDVLMFNDFLKSSKLNIYQLIPALCVQDTILNKDNASLNSMISRNKMKGNRLTILELISNLIDKPNRMKKKKLAKLTIVKFK